MEVFWGQKIPPEAPGAPRIEKRANPPKQTTEQTKNKTVSKVRFCEPETLKQEEQTPAPIKSQERHSNISLEDNKNNAQTKITTEETPATPSQTNENHSPTNQPKEQANQQDELKSLIEKEAKLRGLHEGDTAALQSLAQRHPEMCRGLLQGEVTLQDLSLALRVASMAPR